MGRPGRGAALLTRLSPPAADFGFARYLQSNMMAATLCGSPMYMVGGPSPAARGWGVGRGLPSSSRPAARRLAACVAGPCIRPHLRQLGHSWLVSVVIGWCWRQPWVTVPRVRSSLGADLHAYCPAGARGHHVPALRREGRPVEHRHHRVPVPDGEGALPGERAPGQAWAGRRLAPCT